MVKRLMSGIDAAWQCARPQTRHMPYWKRPEQVMLSHDMTTAQAVEMFRCMNQFIEAKVQNVRCHVSSLMSGTAAMSCDCMPLSDGKYLYRTKDGHVRLTRLPIGGE